MGMTPPHIPVYSVVEAKNEGNANDGNDVELHP